MAIVKDATSTKISNGWAEGTSYTWAHTVAGANRMLVVSACLWQDSPGTGTISGITYNGIALTRKVYKTETAMRSEIWYLVAPDTGTHNIVVTVSGDTDDRKFGAISLTGVNQVVPEASASAGGDANTITVNVTSVTNNAWAVDAVAHYDTNALTIGAGQTVILNNTSGETGMAASYEGPKTPAGAITMSWTTTGGDDWAICAVVVAPSATAATYDVSCTDGFKAGDSCGTAQPFDVSITDGFKLGETVAAGKHFTLSLTDGFKQGDSNESSAPAITLHPTWEICVDWDNDGNFTTSGDNITSDVISLRWSRGRDTMLPYDLPKANTGRCEILLNNFSRNYSPKNATGTHSGKLLPRRPVRIRAIYKGTTYPLFEGFVEKFTPNDTVGGERTCLLLAVDGMDLLARADYIRTIVVEDAPASQTVARIVAASGWPVGKRVMVYYDSTALGFGYGYGNCLEAIRKIEDADYGYFYIDEQGRAYYEDHDYRRLNTRCSTSQFTIADTMVKIRYDYDSQAIINDVIIKAKGWIDKITGSSPGLGILAGRGEERIAWVDVDNGFTVNGIPTITAGGTYTVDVRTKVPLMYISAPQNDYQLSSFLSVVDASGNPAAENLEISITEYCDSATLTFTNPNVYTVYIKLLIITYIYFMRIEDGMLISSSDATSIAKYQKRTRSWEEEFEYRPDHLQQLADHIVAMRKDPRDIVEITLVNSSNAMLQQILSRKLSDRITIQHTNLGLNTDYFIERVSYTATLAGNIIEATWTAEECGTIHTYGTPSEPEGPGPGQTPTNHMFVWGEMAKLVDDVAGARAQLWKVCADRGINVLYCDIGVRKPTSYETGWAGFITAATAHNIDVYGLFGGTWAWAYAAANANDCPEYYIRQVVQYNIDKPSQMFTGLVVANEATLPSGLSYTQVYNWLADTAMPAYKTYAITGESPNSQGMKWGFYNAYSASVVGWAAFDNVAGEFSFMILRGYEDTAAEIEALIEETSWNRASRCETTLTCDFVIGINTDTYVDVPTLHTTAYDTWVGVVSAVHTYFNTGYPNHYLGIAFESCYAVAERSICSAYSVSGDQLTLNLYHLDHHGTTLGLTISAAGATTTTKSLTDCAAATAVLSGFVAGTEVSITETTTSTILQQVSPTGGGPGPGPTSAGNHLYLWGETQAIVDNTGGARAKCLQICALHGITCVYANIGATSPITYASGWASFISDCKTRGIDVYGVFGGTWDAAIAGSLDYLVQNTVTYNLAHPTAMFKGFSLDLEGGSTSATDGQNWLASTGLPNWRAMIPAGSGQGPGLDTINWMGYTWDVKDGNGLGPGPCNWSKDNVWVDTNGYLHLAITNDGGTWHCGEVDMQLTKGFGSYEFVVEHDVDVLNKNIVLGMFNYGAGDGYDEIDLEVARWGNTGYPNGNFGVYPDAAAYGSQESYAFEFSLPTNISTWKFVWSASSVVMTAKNGAGTTVGSWTFTPGNNNKIPQNALNPMINLWLFDGDAPSDSQEVELIIRSFTFIKQGSSSSDVTPSASGMDLKFHFYQDQMCTGSGVPLATFNAICQAADLTGLQCYGGDDASLDPDTAATAIISKGKGISPGGNGMDRVGQCNDQGVDVYVGVESNYISSTSDQSLHFFDYADWLQVITEVDAAFQTSTYLPHYKGIDFHAGYSLAERHLVSSSSLVGNQLTLILCRMDYSSGSHHNPLHVHVDSSGCAQVGADLYYTTVVTVTLVGYTAGNTVTVTGVGVGYGDAGDVILTQYTHT